jgi:hypothetical protein
MTAVIPDLPPEGAPLTCQWCRHGPAAQLVVVDWPTIGRHTSLVCDPCGDERLPDTRPVDAMVWRYRLTLVQEAQSA